MVRQIINHFCKIYCQYHHELYLLYYVNLNATMCTIVLGVPRFIETISTPSENILSKTYSILVKNKQNDFK